MTYRYAAALLLLGTLGACRKQPDEQPAPEYADWYTINAPEARAIEAVTGDIDGTLIITTRYDIYRTTDRGKTWAVNHPSNLGIFGFVTHNDTLFTLTGGRGSVVDSTTAYSVNPTHYSADQGRTWQRYHFKQSTIAFADVRVPRNRVRTPSGTNYRIATESVPFSPGSSTAYLYFTGIQPDRGPLLPLPQEHQLNSIYLDSKARLYVAASAPLCGRGKDFAFCGEQNGVLYVSKKPLP
ncbi:hypothetical protein HHL22_17350 [Hymenobacter sp. RP-2-7]|uniref:Exo-alpha-sialidase n=1 Tax=Hymenobacter polaris TaxID=2682546 RepID=A0A7Y0FNX3_9BACT|nr:hypothetical protein [Hymenobacter polaris]NML66975.1 hypothetical protein [Hymenobacter polaris]